MRGLMMVEGIPELINEVESLHTMTELKLTDLITLSTVKFNEIIDQLKCLRTRASGTNLARP